MGIDYWLVDCSVLSNFALIGKLGLLKEKLSAKLYIPEEVKSEFLLGIEKGVIPKTDIDWLRIVSLTASEDKLFHSIGLRLGRGESACLAIAISRQWKLFTDDADARKTAQRFEVYVSGTIGILVYLIHRNHLVLADGNKMLKDMIDNGYYSPVEKLDSLMA